MARAFVLGHGARTPGTEKTFVPTGRSIAFYSEVDENTLRTNGLAALNAGDIPPVETFGSESEVDNYLMARFEDRAIAQHMASESSLTGGTTYFIGMDQVPSPVRLCTNPTACAKTAPTKHSPFCKGLFNLLDEDEILSVTCRGVRGQQNSATTRLGAHDIDEEDPTHDKAEDFQEELSKESTRLMSLMTTDRGAAIAQIESLSEPSRQMLFSTNVNLRLAVEQYYNDGGQTTPEAVLEARRALEALGEDSFADHVDQYESKQKSMVLDDPELSAAYNRSSVKRAERLALIEHQRKVLEEIQAPIENLQKQAAEIGGAVSLLTGTDSDSDPISALTQAFGSLMDVVGVVQNLADKEGLMTVLSQAVIVYQNGANAANALAVYSEGYDSDNLSKLKTTLDTLVQSAATLPGAASKDLPDV